MESFNDNYSFDGDDEECPVDEEAREQTLRMIADYVSRLPEKEKYEFCKNMVSICNYKPAEEDNAASGEKKQETGKSMVESDDNGKSSNSLSVKDSVKKEVSIYWWKKVIDFLAGKWF